MDGYIFDKNFNLMPIIIDLYDSFIWTERYNSYGDFEIYTSNIQQYLEYCKLGYYLRIVESDILMIIETLQVETDFEEGNKLIITGKSIDSILDRRIVWKQTLLEGNLQEQIKRLLDENVITPENEDRKIPNFIFQESTDPLITKLEIKTQFTGTSVYFAIFDICMSHDLGFKVTVNDDKQFVFQLYSGVDRSFKQTVNPYVIFSSEFDNIVNSSMQQSESLLKTVTLVAGEGEGLERRTLEVHAENSPIGLDRRELFTDARDISSKTQNEENEEVTLTEEEYNELLESRGKEKLAEATFFEAFDGEIEEGISFKYGEDFFMGDIVQVINDYGIQSRARTVEFIRSHDTTGPNVYPTFAAVI